MNNIQSEIKTNLNKLELRHGIRILFACESGSRAWGFPSPDSDYDVRFVYVHALDWYLSINEHRDVIEMPINADLDISGWDLRKTLRLVAKHNSVIYEWIQSPIVYSQNETFLTIFKESIQNCFSPIATMHHYLCSAKKHYEECLFDQVKLKKYFYCLRCALSAAWIASHQTIPPMEIQKLLTLIDDKTLLSSILELISLKAVCDESYIHSRELPLQEFLLKTIEQCELVAPSLPTFKSDINQLNNCFRKIVMN